MDSTERKTPDRIASYVADIYYMESNCIIWAIMDESRFRRDCLRVFAHDPALGMRDIVGEGEFQFSNAPDSYNCTACGIEGGSIRFPGRGFRSPEIVKADSWEEACAIFFGKYGVSEYEVTADSSHA